MTQRFFTGHIPDPTAHLRTSFDHYKRFLSTGPLPLEIDLASFSPIGPKGVPQHFDQGQTGSCGGHARSGSLYTTFKAAGRPLGIVPSPDFSYVVGRCLDRIKNLDGSWPALTDSGSQPNQLVRGEAAYGIRAIRTLPDRFSDCDPISINDDPKLDEIEESLITIVTGSWVITSTGQTRSDDIARAHEAGLDMTVAVNGGCKAFQEYSGGVLTGAALAGDLDHYVRLCGYKTVGGKRLHKLWNSWDDSWGEGGDARLDVSAVDTLGDIYVTTPNKG